MTTSQIYIISLQTDLERRKNIIERLNKISCPYEFIDAIDGRQLSTKEYYSKAKNPHYWFNRRHIISPAELGCRLSHKKAIKSFLDCTDSFWLVVLEDDVSFKNSFKTVINNLDSSTNISEPLVIHLGGQEGIHCRNRVLSFSSFKINKQKYRKIFLPTARWLYRTCGYILNRPAAELLYNLHLTDSFLADDWVYILKKTKITNLGFYDCIEHPLDLSNSTIENERI
ncbi:glycosyltransferase family 25 protein [Kluyvera sp. CHPC 1.2972]|uniref:glycosyltransferase family 25 protein n=1 Tax=Kluyvera sp. CHPC 1.2972 TaxID=2995176 RepID=UPI002FD85B62